MQLIVGRHPNIRNDGSRMPIDVEMSSFFINRERYDSRAHPKLVLSRHYTQNPHSGSMSAIACSRSNDCRHFMESLHSNPSARHRYVRGTSCALERRAGMVDFSPPGFNDQLLFSATVEIQSICSLSGRIKEQLEFILTLAQGVLCPFALGNIKPVLLAKFTLMHISPDTPCANRKDTVMLR
jgi:hypothetical protein